jgi:hypothetical protein
MFLTKRKICKKFQEIIRNKKTWPCLNTGFNLWTVFFGPIPTVPTVVVCKRCRNELMLKSLLCRSRMMLHHKTEKKKKKTTYKMPSPIFPL